MDGDVVHVGIDRILLERPSSSILFLPNVARGPIQTVPQGPSPKPSRPAASSTTALPGGVRPICLRSLSRLLLDAAASGDGDGDPPLPPTPSPSVLFRILLLLRLIRRLSRSFSNAKHTCAHPSARLATVASSLPTSTSAHSALATSKYTCFAFTGSQRVDKTARTHGPLVEERLLHLRRAKRFQQSYRRYRRVHGALPSDFRSGRVGEILPETRDLAPQGPSRISLAEEIPQVAHRRRADFRPRPQPRRGRGARRA